MKRAYVFILLAAAIFSTMEIVSKMLSRDLDPTEINFWRFLIGGTVVLPAALRSMKARGIRLTAGDLAFFLGAAFLGILVSMTFYQLALVHAKAGTVAIIVCSNPVFIIPFACLLLKETIDRNTILSLAACVSGLICILDPLSLNPEVSGILLAIGSAVTFAFYSVIGKGRAARYGSIVYTGFTFLAGAALLLVLIGLSHLSFLPLPKPFAAIPLTAGIGPATVWPLLYLGVVNSGIGFILFFVAMEETSAATGAVAFFIKPALAPILAFLLLGERITATTLAGIVLIVLGTYFAFTRPQPRTIQPAGEG